MRLSPVIVVLAFFLGIVIGRMAEREIPSATAESDPLVERIRVLEIQLAEQNLRLCGVEQEVGTCE